MSRKSDFSFSELHLSNSPEGAGWLSLTLHCSESSPQMKTCNWNSQSTLRWIKDLEFQITLFKQPKKCPSTLKKAQDGLNYSTLTSNKNSAFENKTSMAIKILFNRSGGHWDLGLQVHHKYLPDSKHQCKALLKEGYLWMHFSGQELGSEISTELSATLTLSSRRVLKWIFVRFFYTAWKKSILFQLCKK